MGTPASGLYSGFTCWLSETQFQPTPKSTQALETDARTGPQDRLTPSGETDGQTAGRVEQSGGCVHAENHSGLGEACSGSPGGLVRHRLLHEYIEDLMPSLEGSKIAAAPKTCSGRRP